MADLLNDVLVGLVEYLIGLGWFLGLPRMLPVWLCVCAILVFGLIYFVGVLIAGRRSRTDVSYIRRIK